MGFVLNCQPSSPVWGLAEEGTKALSRHLSVAPCCGTNKEESSRRNLQKPDEMEICNYLGGEEGEGEGEEIGHRAWMGTRGAALLHRITSPSPRASCPGAGGATPKASPKGGCFGGDGVERRCRSLVGSAGPRQGHASSLRAEVAMVTDLPCQATWGATPSTLGITMVTGQRFSSTSRLSPKGSPWWEEGPRFPKGCAGAKLPLRGPFPATSGGSCHISVSLLLLQQNGSHRC